MCTTLLAVIALLGPHPRTGDAIVEAYELDIRFEPEQGTLEGTATVYLGQEPVPEELCFYLHGELRVSSVRASGRELEFQGENVFYPFEYSQVARATRVSLRGADLSDGLRIAYAGPFRPSSARSPSDYMRIDASGVYLRGFGYSLWFPVFLASGADAPVVEFALVRLETPEAFVPVFTGERVASSIEGGRRVTEWVARASLFDAQCTARRYRIEERGSVSIYALDGEDPADAEALAGFASALAASYGEAYRAPDSGQIHVLEMPDFGDMSSGNAIGLEPESWRRIARVPAAQVTLAHELVHHYVAVPIARSDQLYPLVVEGFPSFFHLPCLDALLGEGFYDRFLADTQRTYLERRARPEFQPEPALTQIRADEIGLYKDRFVLNDRALLFLDWLRRSMGTEGFTTFTHELLRRERLDRRVFEQLVEAHLPATQADLALWLDTTEFPERFRLP